MELQQAGKLAEAEEEYRAILAVQPNYAEAHANLGAVLVRLNRYDEALREYETALKLAPNLKQIFLNVGLAHYRNGSFEKAVAAFKQFLKAFPDNAQATNLTALALVELGRDDEALGYLDKALSASPNDPALLYALGLASLRLQKPMVTGVISTLAETPQGLPLSHLLRGQAYLRNFLFEKAIDELHEAEKLNPNLPRLQYSLGLGLFKMGRYPEARAAFEAELKRVPKDSSTLCYLASIDEIDGEFDRARAKLDLALKADPESADAHGLLGRVLLKQGKAAEALKPLETAVKGDPEDQQKHYYLGRAYQQVGRAEDAAREFAESQRLLKESFNKDRNTVFSTPVEKPKKEP